jgi:hypothetical protein
MFRITRVNESILIAISTFGVHSNEPMKMVESEDSKIPTKIITE